MSVKEVEALLEARIVLRAIGQYRISDKLRDLLEHRKIRIIDYKEFMIYPKEGDELVKRARMLVDLNDDELRFEETYTKIDVNKKVRIKI